MAKIKLINILKEARIIPLGANYKNSPHPALYSFVKANKLTLLQILKNLHEENNEEGDFAETTGIENFNDTIVDNENYWKYLDEDNEYPNGQDIEIINPNIPASSCKGIIISNMGPEEHNKFASGYSFSPIPGFDGLYYDLMWC